MRPSDDPAVHDWQPVTADTYHCTHCDQFFTAISIGADVIATCEPVSCKPDRRSERDNP